MSRTLLLGLVAIGGPVYATTGDVVEAGRAEVVAALDASWRADWAALLGDLARGAPSGRVPPDAPARAAALGLALDIGPDSVQLSDGTAPRRGLPVVRLRLGPLPAELVVQAPHPYADLHTGRLAAELYDLGRARAVVIHTTRRDAGPGADPAHSPDGAFQAATDGLSTALWDPLFIQLHGFGEGTTDALVVVSTGAGLGLDHQMTRDHLAGGMGWADVRTGLEVPALAAETNSQGQLLAGRARFLHLEMSLGVRTDLRARPETMRLLGDLLLDLAKRDDGR